MASAGSRWDATASTGTLRAHKEAVSHAVVRESYADVLSLTWSCKCVSTARRSSREDDWRQRIRDAVRSIARSWWVLSSYAVRARPAAIVVEQAIGMITHFGMVAAWWESQLLSMTAYRWRRIISEATALGARHRRQRVWWLGQLVA